MDLHGVGLSACHVAGVGDFGHDIPADVIKDFPRKKVRIGSIIVDDELSSYEMR